MLWGVTVFFEYTHSKDSLYLRNYRLFEKRARAQGLKLLTDLQAAAASAILAKDAEVLSALKLGPCVRP